ncbi:MULTISPECIES: hypothetical protein [unclassified Streptomyces]|uniref:hypothetical protein n=1 Tax=unclassified Streptomyces TaxID=2593676 RepID=UPI0033B98D79
MAGVVDQALLAGLPPGTTASTAAAPAAAPPATALGGAAGFGTATVRGLRTVRV